MRKGVVIIFFAALLFLGVAYMVFTPSQSRLERQSQLLLAENEMLRRELTDVKNSPVAIDHDKFQGVSASTFSSYPFNDKSRIVINAGSMHGIAAGMPVIVLGDLLFGQVEKVHKRYSVVKTIFDGEWSSQIRIGDGQIDALLVGGIEPKIQFIEKGVDLREGELVYSASPLFPYGLTLGSLTDIRDDAAYAFQEALLVPQQNPSALREVYVITNFSE